ncbi:25S rRNA [Spathaspora sp. JA1]|nr:25S rRNA [Spathaspora sp. JA1]
MTLFEVKGWDLKQDKIAVGGVVSKKKARKEKREQKRKAEAEVEVAKATTEDDEKVQPEQSKKRKTEESEPKPQTKKSKSKKEQVKVQPEQVQQPVATTTKLTPLQQKMMAKLSGSRFRWINEQLYTISSESALDLIKSQPSLFDEYHAGFRSQVSSWPENPVNVFVNQIKTRATTRVVNAPGGLPGLGNKKVVIADMGCGEAQLSLDVSKFVNQQNAKKQQKGGRKLDIEVHSFDLKKHNERITVADIKNVPLPDESCTIVIFCLAMMGTNFLDFINEAYRILAPNGELWIAEIKSRFTESSGGNTVAEENIGSEFVETLKLCGFFHKSTDNSNKMFSRFEFFKPSKEIIDQRIAKLQRKKRFIEQETDKEKLDTKRQQIPEGEWLLKPCIYKRR